MHGYCSQTTGPAAERSKSLALSHLRHTILRGKFTGDSGAKDERPFRRNRRSIRDGSPRSQMSGTLIGLRANIRLHLWNSRRIILIDTFLEF